MKSKMKNKFWITMLIGALAIMVPTWAMAVTAPCVPINNAATIDYSVNSVDQADVVSNTATFYVGVSVLFAVATSDVTEVSVTPGNTVSVLNFTVQNNGNAPLRFNLSAIAAGNDTVSPFGGGNDSFNGTNIAVFGEGGNAGGYDAGNDSNTYLDLAPGGNDSAYIVYTPNDLTEYDNEVAVYYLLAEAGYQNGDSFTLSASGNDSISAAQIGTCSNTTVDVVYGDADGPAPGDGDKDGKDSDDSAYKVASATIGVTKAYTVISDPINGGSNPKAIPGAVIEYSIAIANTGGSAAILTTIIDAVDTANLTLDQTAGTAGWTVTGGTRGTYDAGTLTADNADAGGDGLGFATPNLTATMATILKTEAGYATAGMLKNGETVTLTFRATVN